MDFMWQTMKEKHDWLTNRIDVQWTVRDKVIFSERRWLIPKTNFALWELMWIKHVLNQRVTRKFNSVEKSFNVQCFSYLDAYRRNKLLKFEDECLVYSKMIQNFIKIYLSVNVIQSLATYRYIAGLIFQSDMRIHFHFMVPILGTPILISILRVRRFIVGCKNSVYSISEKCSNFSFPIPLCR